MKAKDKLGNWNGNIFVADTDHGAAPSGYGGGPVLIVRWESNEAINLGHHPLARIFKSETAFDGVQIHFTVSPDERPET